MKLSLCVKSLMELLNHEKDSVKDVGYVDVFISQSVLAKVMIY